MSKIGVLKKFLIISLLFLLNSCTQTKHEIEYITIRPSSALIEECKPLSKKEIKTNGDLLNAYNDLMIEYIICSNKIVILKKFYEEYNQKHPQE